jgi:hypothetical protein
MTRPLIRIDDETREMTEEEHAHYLEQIKDSQRLELDDLAS